MTTLYQKTALGKIQKWSVSQNGNILTYEWGYIDGLIQEQKEECKSIKDGTLAYKSAEQQATEIMTRKIEQRIKNGYKTSIEEAMKDSPITDFCFNPLSTSFAPAKPISSKPCLDKKDPLKKDTPNSKIQLLITKGDLWAQRKANGIRSFYVKYENADYSKKNEVFDNIFEEQEEEKPEYDSKLYSRKMKDMSEHFKPLKDLLDKLPIPPNTILDIEITLGGGFTVEQFITVSSMTPNTLPPRSRDIYKMWLNSHEMMPLNAYCFDVIFFDGSMTINKPYKERYKIIHDIYSDSINKSGTNGEAFIVPTNYSFVEAFQKMKENKWEGLVLYDKKSTSEFWMNGKPKRLIGCWKWKNPKETDCFVTEILPEKGNDLLVGSLVIAQYSKDGKIIKRGCVGSGLGDEHAKVAWGWVGKVVKIEYDEILEMNVKGEECFQFPRFMGLHEDKTKEECIFEDEEE